MSFLEKIFGKREEKRRHIGDKERVKSILSGNIDEYSFLVDKYEKPLDSYIKNISYLFSQTERETILQEIFIKAYQKLNSYNPKYEFSTWIYKITRNHVLNILRNNTYNLQYEEDKHSRNEEKDEDFDTFSQIKDDRSDIESNLKEKEQNLVLYHLLDALEYKYKEVLVLRYLESKTLSEISDIMEIPEGTVASYINRAKKQFHQKVENEGGALEDFFEY